MIDENTYISLFMQGISVFINAHAFHYIYFLYLFTASSIMKIIFRRRRVIFFNYSTLLKICQTNKTIGYKICIYNKMSVPPTKNICMKHGLLCIHTYFSTLNYLFSKFYVFEVCMLCVMVLLNSALEYLNASMPVKFYICFSSEFYRA